jgi:hypothetical protein
MGAALRGPLDEPCAPVKLRTPPCGRNRFRSWHDSHPKPARRGSRLDHPFIIGLLLGGTSLFRQAVVPQARPSLRLACYRLRMPVRTMIALLLTGTLALPSCARSQRAAIAPRADGPGETIPVELVRPEGPGPFPAVVLLHSCAGLGRGARHAGDWIRRLVAMGYAVALPR